MLTSDDGFNHNANHSVIDTVEWYQEYTLTNMPLSSLLLVVLLRTVFASLHSHTGKKHRSGMI